jgi:hypothetical protein
MLPQDIIDLHCQCVDELHRHFVYYMLPDHEYALLLGTIVTAARKSAKLRDFLSNDHDAITRAVYQHGFKKWTQTCQSHYATEEEFLSSMPDPEDHFACLYKHGRPRRTATKRRA